MKRYRLFFKVILLVVLSLLLAFLFYNGLYLTSSLAVLFILLLAYSLYNDQQRVIKRIEQMISNIHYGDLNLSFHSTTKGAEGDLVRSMNEALCTFRARLYNSVIVETENEAWQKLVRVLTHEIMNSIAPIISLAETVTERAIQNEINEDNYHMMLQSMQSIHRRSKGLLVFVENYRKLTRIPTPVIQSVSIQELFLNIEHLFSSTPLSFTYSIVPSNLHIYADSSLIEQVLINLIKNAIEACTDTTKGEIEVKAFRKDGASVITIHDNGRGIVPEAIDKIFVPFYTTTPGGSGIGLSLCRQIINHHDGSISVFSEEEKGTTFSISFPLSYRI